MVGLVIVRILMMAAGLGLGARLVFSFQAYSTWRAMGYFTLACLALLTSAGLDLYAAVSGAPTRAASEALSLVGALSLLGLLWEKLSTDRQRQKDAQKLLDQWRLASNLATRRAGELEMLADVTRELASSLNLREVLQAVVDRALRLGGADAVTVFVRNRDTGELNDYHVTAAAEGQTAPQSVAPGQLLQTVADTAEPAFIPDLNLNRLYAEQAPAGLRGLACLPLRLEDEVVGVMQVGYSRPHHFEDGEMRLMSAVAGAGALAVHNASLHERISRLAVTDDLTGLANRRRFLDAVRSEIQRARRYHRPLTLVMVDLDRLKQINDQNGHAAGDAMLRGVAQALRASVRDTDLPARLGGDEFAVLLPETHRQAGLTIAERVRRAVEDFRTVVNGASIQSTVSVGLVARDPQDLQDLPSLIHLADEALYRSKAQGRNQVTALDAAPQD